MPNYTCSDTTTCIIGNKMTKGINKLQGFLYQFLLNGIFNKFSIGMHMHFFQNSCSVCTYCIAANNNGNVNVDGFGNTNAAGIPGSIILINCIGYNNGRDGVRLGVSGTVQTYATQIINSIFVNNAGYGINNSSGTTLVSGVEYLNYNSFYNNTLGNYNALPSGPNDILTLTSDPFVNGASNNFILNNTINSGAALKNVGYPGVLTIGGTGYLDIGTLQHISTPTPTGTPINR